MPKTNTGLVNWLNTPNNTSGGNNAPKDNDKGAASGYPKGSVIPPTKVEIKRPEK